MKRISILYNLLAVLVVAAAGLQFSGCAVRFRPARATVTVATPYYTPLYYHGYIVYYDTYGRPMYYANGVRYYVPAGYARYHVLWGTTVVIAGRTAVGTGDAGTDFGTVGTDAGGAGIGDTVATTPAAAEGGTAAATADRAVGSGRAAGRRLRAAANGTPVTHRPEGSVRDQPTGRHLIRLQGSALVLASDRWQSAPRVYTCLRLVRAFLSSVVRGGSR